MRFLSTLAMAILALTATAAPLEPRGELTKRGEASNHSQQLHFDHGNHGNHGDHEREDENAPTFHNYPGYGEDAYKTFHYSQAVRIGNIIQTAGQGGWDPNTSLILEGRDAQLDQMFKNVELALKTAGGSGWEQVYHVRSYHIPLDDDTLAAMADRFAQWMPGKNKPVWTASAVVKLAFPGQVAEMDVEAYSPQ